MEKIIELRPGIILYRDVMPDPANFINKIEKMAESKKVEWTEAEHSGGQGQAGQISYDIRQCGVLALRPFDNPGYVKADEDKYQYELHEELNKYINPVLNDYLSYYSADQWNKNYEGWQILKYNQNGHFVNHYDDCEQFKRTVSISYYLNGDFEGGEIEFQRHALKIKPEENFAIIFPSNYVNNHIVHPVTSGTRYTCVGWFDC